MAGGERRHGWLVWLTVLALLTVLVAGLAVWRLEPLRPVRDLVVPATSPAGSPSPPATAELLPSLAEPGPPSPAVDPVARPEAGSADPARVRRALAAGLADPDLGRHVAVLVADLSDGAQVFAQGSPPVIPASTMKLLTAVSALDLLGPDHVFITRVVTGRGRVVLVGGGDPYLASRAVPHDELGVTYPPRGDVRTLAHDAAQTLRSQGRRRVRVGYDASLFTGPAAAPSWEPDYLTDDVVSPITALWVDEGREPGGYDRVTDPAAYAAGAFARALAREGIRVVGRPVPTTAPGGAELLASVDSAPLAQIVERVLDVSDNEAAEVLAHHVGLAAGEEGSFEGGVRGVEQSLRGLGVPLAGASLHDGSGLSRSNRLDPRTLVELLRVAADPLRPELRPALTGLPVAGFTGSLSYRFADGPAQGRGQVRAKTGTLTGVSGLAGLVTDLDGTTMVFVMVADRVRKVDTLDAREGLDQLAAALAACRCSR